MFNYKEAKTVESAEFVRQNWEAGGDIAYYEELMECKGEKFYVTYAFELTEIDGLELEDYPWDEEHVSEVAKLVED